MSVLKPATEAQIFSSRQNWNKAMAALQKSGKRNASPQELPRWDRELWNSRKKSDQYHPDTELIYRLRLGGLSYQKIGEEFGLTRQRVQALCKRVAEILTQ